MSNQSAGGGVRFGRIPVATSRSGLSRSKLYEIARQHRGLFKKAGSATIVDLLMLDEIVSDFPAAEISAPKSE